MIEVAYPVGHRERRKEGIPILKEKFENSIKHKLKSDQWSKLNDLFQDDKKLNNTYIDEFMSLLVS